MSDEPKDKIVLAAVQAWVDADTEPDEGRWALMEFTPGEDLMLEIHVGDQSINIEAAASVAEIDKYWKG